MEDISFEARVLHTPYEKPDAYNALSMPVYNTAAYEFDTAEAMEAAFCGNTSDHAYSRITNPTVQYFEDRVRAITGAMSVTALNSGMAAICNTLMTIGRANANIVTSPHLFGNTFSLMKNTLAAFGMEARFCDLTNPDEVRAQHRLQYLCPLSGSDHEPAAGSRRSEAAFFYRKRSGHPVDRRYDDRTFLRLSRKGIRYRYRDHIQHKIYIRRCDQHRGTDPG